MGERPARHERLGHSCGLEVSGSRWFVMRVLHVISCLVKAAGHSQVCLNLAARLTGQADSHLVFTLQNRGGAPLPDPKGVVRYAEGRHFRLLNIDLPLDIERQLRSVVRAFKPDIVHLHGGWHPVLFFGAKVARREGVPVVFSPHGSLHPLATSQDRRLRKLLAWMFYQRRLVGLSSRVLAASESERGDVLKMMSSLAERRPGCRRQAACSDAHVLLVPNAIDVDEFRGEPDRRTLEHAYPACAGKSLALSLARLCPVKGLDLLIAAWRRLAAQFPDWCLMIAGPDEGGYEKELRRQVQNAGLEKQVLFLGPVYGKSKVNVMKCAEVLVLPSRGENFGLVVAEALVCGKPVIATKGVPWSELLGGAGSQDVGVGRSGWWVDVDESALAEALREAMLLTAEERLLMGENGRRLVLEKYTWDRVAEQTRDIYKEVLREGACAT